MENKYLYLKHFGIREKDVIFIDSTNIKQINYQQ